MPALRVALLVLISALAVSLPTARARVFQVLGPALNGATAAGQPGWTAAYTSTLDINGGRADLEVLGAGLDPGDAQRMLETAYRGRRAYVLSGHGSGLGWGIALEGDRVVRWLVVDVHRTRECVVFRIGQTRAEFLASGRRPTAHRLDAVPAPPQAEPRLYVADEATDAAIEVSVAPSEPVVEARIMDAALVSSGWIPVVPQDPSRGIGTRLYTRRGELCTVQVSAASGGGSTVLRYHKKLRGREGL